MPTFEWTAVGDEPGCRQAAMDPQIKLFGQTISVSPSHTGAGADAEFLNPPSAYTAPPSSQDGGDSVQHRGAENKGASETLVCARSSSGDELLQLHVKSRECGVAPSGVPQLCDEHSEGGVSDERDSQSVGSDGKSQQKAEKVVACPRCSSQDTKFCYYNNYNVNQPRHFCKNCQRYWTAGGTLRNVPVGAGRRKNKASGGAHQQGRENSEASLTCSSFQMELGEFSCGVGSPRVKVSHGKRVAGQGSPVRSPGRCTSLGQESGMSMSSPPYSLYQNGRQSLQSFISVSHGFNSSGTEVSGVGSSDSASTMRGGESLVRFLSGTGGFEQDCRRSSVIGPHGYPVDWDSKHQGFASGCAIVSGQNTSAGGTPAWVSTPWASNVGHHPPVSWNGSPQQVLPTLLGKRQGEVAEDCFSVKRLQTDLETKSKWPMLQERSKPFVTEGHMLKQLLHQPKLEQYGAAYDQKDSFMSRLFNNATGPWPVPFPVAN